MLWKLHDKIKGKAKAKLSEENVFVLAAKNLQKYWNCWSCDNQMLRKVEIAVKTQVLKEVEV